jgi:hypothetical protein
VPVALELCQHPIALLLALVTVQSQRRPAVAAQRPCDVITATFGFAEDEHLGSLLCHDLLQQVSQARVLVILCDDLNNLCDVVVGLQVWVADDDLAVQRELQAGTGTGHGQGWLVSSHTGNSMPMLCVEKPWGYKRWNALQLTNTAAGTVTHAVNATALHSQAAAELLPSLCPHQPGTC